MSRMRRSRHDRCLRPGLDQVVLAFMTGFIAADAALADAWDEESGIVVGSLAIAAIWCVGLRRITVPRFGPPAFPLCSPRQISGSVRALISPVHHIASVPAIMSIHGTIASVPRIFMQTAVSPECAHMPRRVRVAQGEVIPQQLASWK
jgi:hypothetical protein